MLLRMQIRRVHPMLSIAEVADKIGIGRHTLYSWTSGSRTPRPLTLRGLLRKLSADDATVMRALLLLSSPGGQ